MYIYHGVHIILYPGMQIHIRIKHNIIPGQIFKLLNVHIQKFHVDPVTNNYIKYYIG